MPDTPQGNQTQSGQGEGDPAPKYVTEEQLNRAITARFKDFEKKIEKANEGLSSTLTGKLDELLAAKLESQTEKPDGKDQKDGKAAEPSPEMKAMQREMSELKKQLDNERKEKDSERAKARDTSLRQKLTEALTAAGINGVSLKHAVSVLVDGEKRARLDDDGARVLFRGDDGDELPLADGLKSWLKSEDAKIYLPPRGVAGSGHGPGGSAGRPQQQGNSVNARAAELLARHLGSSLL